MKTITKIACRTIGAAGIGYALYDAWRVGNHFSKVESEKVQSAYIEKAYFDSRNSDTVSFTDNDVRKKTFDLRVKNPIPSFWGKIKGGIEGSVYSLGNNLFTVACSAFALLSKGFMAKAGTVGLMLGACYNIVRNGFGLGKHNPMG